MGNVNGGSGGDGSTPESPDKGTQESLILGENVSKNPSNEVADTAGSTNVKVFDTIKEREDDEDEDDEDDEKYNEGWI